MTEGVAREQLASPFFFQAEDGIRDLTVTGVQTCALPISGALIYTNSYYYIGHFSKFVRPGARRILASPSRSMLLATAFVNLDGTVAVVVMNPTARGGQYSVVVGSSSVEIGSRPHSIQTVVFKVR